MESEQMLPIYKKPLVKKDKSKWRRNACSVASLTLIFAAVIGAVFFYVGNKENEAKQLINGNLDISVSLDDENVFSFNDLLKGELSDHKDQVIFNSLKAVSTTKFMQR